MQNRKNAYGMNLNNIFQKFIAIFLSPGNRCFNNITATTVCPQREIRFRPGTEEKQAEFAIFKEYESIPLEKQKLPNGVWEQSEQNRDHNNYRLLGVSYDYTSFTRATIIPVCFEFFAR